MYNVLTLKDLQNLLNVSLSTAKRIKLDMLNEYKPKSNKILKIHFNKYFNVD